MIGTSGRVSWRDQPWPTGNETWTDSCIFIPGEADKSEFCQAKYSPSLG